MYEEPKNDFSHTVGVVTENVTRAAITTGAVVVEKTKDAACAIGKAAQTVAESETVKGAVSYVQDKTSQAVDYITGKSEDSTNAIKDETNEAIIDDPKETQGFPQADMEETHDKSIDENTKV